MGSAMPLIKTSVMQPRVSKNTIREVFGAAKEQRCWFYKTGNVLNAIPKEVKDRAKGHMHVFQQTRNSKPDIIHGVVLKGEIKPFNPAATNFRA